MISSWIAIAAVPHTAAAQTPPALAVVMDSSGSMWGRLTDGDRPKYQAATGAVLAALAIVPAGTQTSLVNFGQRSRGGCSFADVLLPLSTHDGPALAAGFGKLNPQGRGPLALGIQTAAEMLATTKGPKSIVVVHDDPDNCGQDICAVASVVKQTLPELRIFVLSLEPKPENSGAMACVAQITGGRVIETSNQATMEAAAKAIVLAALASTTPRNKRPAETASSKETGPQPTAPKAAPVPRRVRAPTPGLMLSAHLVKDGPELGSGLIWTIKSAGSEKALLERRTAVARPSISLAPGLYDVTLHAGARTELRKIEVKNGPRTTARFELDAAALSFSATLSAGGAIVQDALFELRAGEKPGGEPIWSGLAPPDPLILPAGTYQLKTSADRVERQSTVTLRAGQNEKLSVPLEAGYLTVNTVRRSGESPDGATVTVEVDDSKSPNGRRVIARSIQSMPSFLLPAGTYYVTASLGTAVVQDQVGIRVGKIIEQTITIPFMKLQVLSRLRGRTDDVAKDLRYRLWQLRAPDTPPLVTEQADPTFELAPGAYRIESRIGSQNAVVVRDFEVTPAPAGKLTLQHEAGTVQLGIDPKFDPKEVYWEIRQPDNDTIWRSLQRQPLVTLKAGRYRIVAEVDGQTSSNEVDVKSGAHLNIRLGLN